MLLIITNIIFPTVGRTSCEGGSESLQ